MMKILVLFGTLTGNTEIVANQIYTALKTINTNVTLKNVIQTKAQDLEEADFIIAGASTWDDGMIQVDFGTFLEEIANEQPELKNKKIAIFALGDSGYPQFCTAADVLEEQFAKYGLQPVTETLKLDGFPDEAENSQKTIDWIEKLKKIATT
jgi:flavodoxin I